MPSSNDSTNPSSPFGVEYGYPQGTRITKNPDAIAQIQQEQMGFAPQDARLFSTSRETLFRPASLPRVYPTKGQKKQDDTVKAMSEDPIALGTARYMAHPEVAQAYFNQVNNRDQKALEQAHRAFQDPQKALESVFPKEEVYASSLDEAKRVVSEKHRSETHGLQALAQRVVKRAGVEAEVRHDLTKGQHLAGRLIAHQIERNVQQPMSFEQAQKLAQQKLGREAGDVISAVGGKRLDPYSEKEKSAFKEAKKEIKGSEPKINQPFSDLTTVVKELSTALKELTKSTKGQTQQESKSDLIQQRHDLAVQRDQQKQDLSTARTLLKTGARKEEIQQSHDLAVQRQDRRQYISAGTQAMTIQQRHDLDIKKMNVKHTLDMEKEKFRQDFQREMRGNQPTRSQFLLGMMHRGDVLSPTNLMGRGLRRIGQGGFNMAMGVAGGSGISQSLGAMNPFGIPMGALTAQPFNMLTDVSSKASEIELVSMQAQFLNTGVLRRGAMIKEGASGYTVDTIFELSNQLGISPSQSASMLKNVGLADPMNQFSPSDLATMTIGGISPESVAQIGGQLRMLGTGLGSKEVVGLFNRSKMQGALGMNFAQRIVEFTRGRQISGLRTGRDFLGATASRIQSMGVGVEEGLTTLGKMQGMVVQSGQGLTQMFGGMTDLALQSYAFEKAGGDLFKAQGEMERMSGSPEMMRQALLSRGMTRGQARLALLGKGFTTDQVKQLEKARATDRTLDTNIDKIDTSESLVVSRKLASKQQADIKLAYSMADDGEAMVDKLDAILKADIKYQQSMLKTMVKASQIAEIGEAITGITTLFAQTNVVIADIASLIQKARKFLD